VKHLFVVNPVAGKADKSSDIADIANHMFESRDDSFEIYVTKAPMDAAEAIKRYAQECPDEELRVYSCGGDGTFNECVCGAAGLKNVAVVPYATGTGNDFIRTFGDEKGLFYDMGKLINGTVHPIDIIDCNGRACVNICSMGLDARVGTDVHKYSKIPLLGGATGYVTSAVVNVFKGMTQHMEISGCGCNESGEYTMVCVCNGRYYGGGFNPIKDTKLDDGLMDVLVVNAVRVGQVPSVIMKYAKGEYYKLPKFITRYSGTEIKLTMDEECVVNVDGEAMYTKEMVFKVVPGGVNFIVPKGMQFFNR